MQHMPVYLDNNATTPCDPRVVEAMLPCFTTHFGNAASRNHAWGWAAEEAVQQAREEVAGLIGADQQEIVFTSGATEALNLALKGAYEAYAVKGKHLITVQTEHKAVLDTCHHLEKLGAIITYLPVDGQGLINPDDLKAAIRPDTILAAVMYANNETGVIQPIPEIGRIAAEHDILLLTDATQAVGKIPLNVSKEGIGMLAMSAHKLYGPKGAGALYVRRRSPRVRLTAQMDGGGHERGMRSGTLNVPGIAGLGKACALAADEMAGEALRLAVLRDKLEAALVAQTGAIVNGGGAPRLPHVTNLRFPEVKGTDLLRVVSREIAVSSGSACTSANPEPSHVLLAMGVPEELAHSSLRFGLGRFTTESDIDRAIETVNHTVRSLHAIYNL
ncbi:cysteine desulfurase family protein [Chitinophaga deserti]|uniref:cysteine desulfurase family protein n=1 Tax=Chitinophaga deserti TaxID=2164099 RepID=UPI000D6BDAD9|nr:cysteine desulfurase family protein [Chitinophaga deserti]